MRYLGYLKEFDEQFHYSRFLKDYRKNGRKHDLKLLSSVIEYLKKGTLLWTWMEYWLDDEERNIGGASYYTDGKWIWPLYYIHYLEKYQDLEVDQEFLEDLKLNKGVQRVLTEQELIQFEQEYCSKLNIK